MRNLLVAIAVLLTAASFGQKGKMNNLTPPEKTQKFINRWTKELTLTPEQQTKANPIVLNMFTKMEELRMDTTMGIKERNNAFRNARKTGMEGFKAILTADQAAQFDKKMQEMKDKKKEGKPGSNKKDGNNDVKKEARNELENDDVF